MTNPKLTFIISIIFIFIIHIIYQSDFMNTELFIKYSKIIKTVIFIICIMTIIVSLYFNKITL